MFALVFHLVLDKLGFQFAIFQVIFLEGKKHKTNGIYLKKREARKKLQMESLFLWLFSLPRSFLWLLKASFSEELRAAL